MLDAQGAGRIRLREQKLRQVGSESNRVEASADQSSEWNKGTAAVGALVWKVSVLQQRLVEREPTRSRPNREDNPDTGSR
ncbi:MAG: hypothetical protein SGI98_00945 [Verrucomicrobiota bacterium]|nr:hypothetical protein [Verrucomicrobiota bacterium]